MHRGITGSIRLDNHIFDCSNADSSLADLMLRPTDGVHRCITEFIRLEKKQSVYKLARPGPLSPAENIQLSKKSNANEPVDLIPVPSGLLAYLLLIPLRGQ